MADGWMRRYFPWAAGNGLLREFEAVAARGLQVTVRPGDKMIRSSTGKEPFLGAPPARCPGMLSIGPSVASSTGEPRRVRNGPGEPLKADQGDGAWEVEFSGRVMSVASSGAETAALVAGDPDLKEVQVDVSFEDVAFPDFTSADSMADEEEVREMVAGADGAGL